MLSARTVIVEDDPTFLQLMRLMLNRQPGVQVEAVFANGNDALDYCRREAPDMVLVDIHLEGMDGLELARLLRMTTPSSRILVVTGHPEPSFPAQLLAMGVSGYVSKTESVACILQGVETVLRGGLFFASSSSASPFSAQVPALASAGVSNGRSNNPFGDVRVGSSSPFLAGPPASVLSPREAEIARLVVAGQSSKEIAAFLSLSTRTVEKHRANIMNKAGVREVASLVRWCVQVGL